MSVEFKDFSHLIISKMEETCENFLEEAGMLIEAGAKDRTAVKTSQLKGSWTINKVGKYEVQVGSPLERAIWYERGTGEKALDGNGRKGGWIYTDPETGKRIFTRGSRPFQPLEKSYEANKNKIIKRGQQLFGDAFKGD